MKRVSAVWEDLQAGSAHHSGAGGFVPAVAAGWFPEEFALPWGCVVVEAVALWLQQKGEGHWRGSQVKEKVPRRGLTQGGYVVVEVEELCHPH